jgi:hypothetical protein
MAYAASLARIPRLNIQEDALPTPRTSSFLKMMKLYPS